MKTPKAYHAIGRFIAASRRLRETTDIRASGALRLARRNLSALALAATACVATMPEPASPIMALLIVDNQRTVDETIYLNHEGAKGRRIGRVGSLSIDTLPLRESDGAQGADFQLLAVAFAAGNVDQSPALPLLRGAVYRWQLTPSRGIAFLSRSAE